jgi:hypothetical protein
MDDELHRLEAELKRLRPAAPSRELATRVECDLALPPARRSLAHLRWLWVVALPIAAAVAIGFMQFTGGKSPPAVGANVPPVSRTSSDALATNDSPLKPVAAENILVAARDEGLVTLEDGTQARRERRHYVDTITWKNPRTNASLTWSMPREEVRVVPIAFQ